MDNVYGKIKQRQVEPVKRIISNARLFEQILPGSVTPIAYSPETLLGEDDWYTISDFSTKDYYPKYVETIRTSVEFHEMNKTEFQKLSCLISVQNDDLYFQRITPSALLKRKTIGFGDMARVDNSETRIVVNYLPDAVYFESSDQLWFRDLARISPIFSGVEKLFIEATDEEVRSFLDQPFVFSREFSVGDVSKSNRKRIALALDSLSKMTDEQKDGIVSYVREYCDERLNYDKARGTFDITSDTDLKYLIYGIEERYYTASVHSEKRLANSIVRL